MGDVVWPGRFQEIDRFIVDGAHNPPAAEALVAALGNEKVDVIAGFCGNKDAEEVMRIHSPIATRPNCCMRIEAFPRLGIVAE